MPPSSNCSASPTPASARNLQHSGAWLAWCIAFLLRPSSNSTIFLSPTSASLTCTIRVGSPEKQRQGVELRIAGPQNKSSVHPNHRGQALSAGPLALAMRITPLLQNFDAGLLFCTPNLERLYQKTGWQTLTNGPITRAENNTDLLLPKSNIAMFLPLKQKTFPAGPHSPPGQ